jgi:hypothetical protein
MGLVFKSLPGAGNVLACKLLALFGDNKDRFNDYNGVQCLFGTAPQNYQSGMYHKVIMRKACNKSARAILYKFAFSSLQFSDWARCYYDNQRAKGKTHSVAVRALSNKWIKIIYKLWKDEILYCEDKKIASLLDIVVWRPSKKNYGFVNGKKFNTKLNEDFYEKFIFSSVDYLFHYYNYSYRNSSF